MEDFSTKKPLRVVVYGTGDNIRTPGMLATLVAQGAEITYIDPLDCKIEEARPSAVFIDDYCQADVLLTLDSYQALIDHKLQLQPIRPVLPRTKPKAQWKQERSKFYQGPKK